MNVEAAASCGVYVSLCVCQSVCMCVCMCACRADKPNGAYPVDAVTSRSTAQVTVGSARHRVDQSGGHPDEDVVVETISAIKHRGTPRHQSGPGRADVPCGR